jgi:lipopolysaccharide heptosyltransferase II
MKDFTTDNIKRIVVRGTNWVGDAVMGVPALRELRSLFPESHITLVVRPWAEGLFKDCDFIDALLIYERKGAASVWQQVREWRQQRFDLAVLFQNAFEAALIPFLARIPRRVGYATDGRRLLLSHPLALPAWRDTKHEVFYYTNIVAELRRLLERSPAINAKELDCSLTVSATRRSQAANKLSEYGVRKGSAMVALCPGSINSRAKRWPAERYARLADRLIEEINANVLLIGSKEERDVTAEVARQMKQPAIDLAGETSLDEAVAILGIVDLLVTNDTGPAHIASAQGKPTLVIFGPTNPLTTRPYSAVAEIVRRPPDCAPCMLRDCPIDHRCMEAISVDEVFTKALSMLSPATVAPAANHSLAS